MLSPSAYWLLLLAMAAYAFGRGRIDERLAAGICVFGSMATVIVSSPLNEKYSSVETGVLIVDSLALLGFVLLALRSRRYWPLWVAAFQLTSVFAHILKAIRWDLLPQVYAAAERFWIYPIFLVIVLGTWRGRQRTLRDGTEHLRQHAA